MNKRRRTHYLLMAAALGLISQTAGAAIKWSFDPTSLNNEEPSSTTFANGSKAAGPSIATPYQFYGNKSGNSTYVAATTYLTLSSWADTGVAGNVGNTLKQGNTFSYGGGLGVQWLSATASESTSAPEHTMDNCGSWNGTSCTASAPEEFILFSFNEAVALSQVSIGWMQSDSDITVLAYDPSLNIANPNPADLTKNTYDNTDALAGTTSGLINDGWKLIGNYADLALNTDTNINAGGFASKYWLIGAYNSRVAVNQPGWTDNNDFIKIASITGSTVTPPPPGVPEPATLALLSLCLPGVWASKRRLRSSKKALEGALS